MARTTKTATTNDTTDAKPTRKRAPRTPTKTAYTTADMARALGYADDARGKYKLRRRLRANDIRIGSGNRHSWSKTEFDRIVKRLT